MAEAEKINGIAERIAQKGADSDAANSAAQLKAMPLGVKEMRKYICTF